MACKKNKAIESLASVKPKRKDIKKVVKRF